MESEIDLLQQTQEELEQIAEEVEFHTGVDRREFVFLSLVAAAASTFGVSSKLRAQGGGGRGGAGAAPQTPPPPIPLGEPISWTFQAYPGGTGAILEKLRKERGAKAFDRAVWTLPKWTGAVPTNDDDIAFLPAHRLAALIKERKITSARLTDIYLARMKRLDPTLLCAVTIMEESARAEAARADDDLKAGRYRGPLHGIPYGVKDLFSTKGVRTTWGSEEFENRIIDEDAEIVVRLRDAGAVLIAKLASGRYASGDQWYRGRTNNPWDIRRGASGSSTGPGSATAAACVAFGIGTETSGSIVSPSRENGLSALRPTFGRVSRHGGMVLAWSRDRVGPMCRTIEDVAMVFNVIHGVDEKDPSTIMAPFHFDRNIKLASLRIGVAEDAPKELVDKLKELGAVTKPIGARPQQQGGGGGGGGGESTAFFDYFVQQKAKELGIDLATLEAALVTSGGRGGGGGRGGRGGADSTATGRGGAADSTAGRGNAPPLDPRFAGVARMPGTGGAGRNSTALNFIQSQRRRHMVLVQWAEFLKEYDMYIPAPAGDVGLHSQTGHPSAVVQYKFETRTSGGRGGGGRGGAAAADTTAGRAGGGGRGAGRGGADSTGRGGGRGGEQFVSNPMPTCAQIIGNLVQRRFDSVGRAQVPDRNGHSPQAAEHLRLIGARSEKQERVSSQRTRGA